MITVMTHLEELSRGPADEAAYAWWVARLVFTVEEEIERVLREDRRRVLRPSAN